MQGAVNGLTSEYGTTKFRNFHIGGLTRPAPSTGRKERWGFNLFRFFLEKACEGIPIHGVRLDEFLVRVPIFPREIIFSHFYGGKLRNAVEVTLLSPICNFYTKIRLIKIMSSSCYRIKRHQLCWTSSCSDHRGGHLLIMCELF